MATSTLTSAITRANGGSIPTVKFTTISLSRLRLGDEAELRLLAQAASASGFFYLDLHGDPEGERVLADLPSIYALTGKYFAQPAKAKVNDVRHDILPSQDIGYKSSGPNEMFELSQSEMNLQGVSHLPHVLRESGEQLLRFNAGCNDACMTVLRSLDLELAEHHRDDQPSDTGLKLILGPTHAKLEDVGENLHTDSGTLTLLFYDEWGLHASLPDAGVWGFIPPLEGCAVVNVADSLQRLSGGKFRSPQHRITQPCDGAKERYYISYYLRPATALKEKWADEHQL